MTSHPSHPPVSALRERMIEDMTVRGFGQKTPPRLRPACQDVRGFHRPRARHGDRRGGAPLPTAPGRERRAATEHQQRGRRLTLPVHRDARAAGSRPPAHGRARGAQAAGGAERRGGRASDRGSTGAEVPGGVRHGLWRRATGRRGGRAQGRRRQQHAHDAAGRAGQGTSGSLCDTLVPTAHAVLQAMSAIENCRTAALGGHVERCEDCDHTRIADNGCRNRLAAAHMPRIGPAPGGAVVTQDVGDLQPGAAHGRRVRPPVSASPRGADRAGRGG